VIAEPLLPLARPIGEFRLLDGNPRRGDVASVKRSLQRFGQRKPIVVRADGTVEAGNTTLKAALELGWAEIAVVAFGDDDVTAKAFALADNRTSELGSFDLAALALMAAEVHAVDPGLLEAASFTEADLNALLAGQRVPPKLNDPDDVPEPPGEPVTVLGDVWQLGPHRLICGDCRDFGTLERLLAGARVNLAFTSPPYASQRAYDESSGFQPIPPDGYVDWFEDVQAGVRAALEADGSWFVNIKEHCDDGQRHLYVKDLTIAHVRRWGWRLVDEFCWARNSVPGGWNNRFKNAWEPVFHFCGQQEIKFRPDAVAVETDAAFTYSPDNPKSATGFFSNRGRPDIAQPGMARPSNVLKIGAETRQTDSHSAPFPVALPAWFMRAYTDHSDTVLDPFMGSGSTLIAAHQEGRTAYGTEISPAYCDVICRRYQEHTGTKPVLAATGEPHDFTA
jgi:DNA modification methylase